MPRKAFPSAGSGQAGVAESSCDLLPKAKRAQEAEPALFINPGNDLLSHTVASAVPWVLKGKNVSGKDQAAFGLRDGATEFNPEGRGLCREKHSLRQAQFRQAGVLIAESLCEEPACPKKQNGLRKLSPLCLLIPATTYSPTPLPAQYHRR